MKDTTKNTNIQGTYKAIAIGLATITPTLSKSIWKNQGNSSSTTKTSLESLLIILPLGF